MRFPTKNEHELILCIIEMIKRQGEQGLTRRGADGFD